MIVICVVVCVGLMAGAAFASAVINILCEEERDLPVEYGEVWEDAE